MKPKLLEKFWLRNQITNPSRDFLSAEVIFVSKLKQFLLGVKANGHMNRMESNGMTYKC